MGEKLGTANPADLKEHFSRMVTKITCRWEKTKTKGGRTRVKLVKGEVEFRDDCLFSGGWYAKA